MKKILRYLRSSLGYLYVCFKWVILAALVGCVVGPFGAMFGLALNKATALRTADPRLIYLLPLAAWSSYSCTSILTLMAAAPPTKFLSRCGSISRFPCVLPRSSL